MNILKSRKKANEDKEFKRLKKEVLKEFNKDYYRLAHDVSVQVIAATLYTLTRRYDFTQKEIIDFIDALQDTYTLMQGSDYLAPFNADDICKQIKKEYNIDLTTFIKIGWSDEAGN